MHKCILQIERDYEKLVGRERLAQVRDALGLIAYGPDAQEEG